PGGRRGREDHREGARASRRAEGGRAGTVGALTPLRAHLGRGLVSTALLVQHWAELSDGIPGFPLTPRRFAEPVDHLPVHPPRRPPPRGAGRGGKRAGGAAHAGAALPAAAPPARPGSCTPASRSRRAGGTPSTVGLGTGPSPAAPWPPRGTAPPSAAGGHTRP